MSSPANRRSRSNPTTARILLWVVLALTVALLGWLNVFTAQRNPYLSDVGRNKISRSAFIEACKAKFDAFADTVAKSQNAGHFGTGYVPTELFSGAVSNPSAPGWLLSSQVRVTREGYPSQTVPFACQSDAKGEVTLAQAPGAGTPAGR